MVRSEIMKRMTARDRRLFKTDEVGRQINLLIPVSKHKAFKRYALEHDTSMSKLLSEWIDEHVQDDLGRGKAGA